MTLIRLICISLTFFFTTTACAIKSTVLVPPVAVSEFSKDVFDSPFTIEYLFSRNTLRLQVVPVGAGAIGCSFQIDAASAVYAAFNAVNRHSFRNIVERGTAGSYHIQIKLETFDVDVTEANRSFGVVALADARIVFAVSFFNPKGVELGQRTIRGEGEAEQSLGSCLGEKPILLKAVQDAVASSVMEYRRRVIEAIKLPH